jgi:hypothetical protein
MASREPSVAAQSLKTSSAKSSTWSDAVLAPPSTTGWLGSPRSGTVQISRTRLRTFCRKGSNQSLVVEVLAVTAAVQSESPEPDTRQSGYTNQSCAPYITGKSTRQRLLCIFEKVNDRSVAKDNDLTSQDPRSKVLRYEILLPYIFRC